MRELETLLGQAQAERRVAQHVVRQRRAAASSSASGTTRETSPSALGARGVDEVARQQQLGRHRRADDARQEVADADVAGREPDADEGGVHARRLAGEPHVGGERQREPAAAGGALHGRDDRLRRPAHEHHELADRALRAQATLHRAADRAVAVTRVLLQVEPGAERSPGAAQHDHARLAIVVQPAEEVAAAHGSACGSWRSTTRAGRG